MSKQATYDFTDRAWGHNFMILELIDGGKQIRVAGWGEQIVKNDFLILPNGPEGTTRYLVLDIKYEVDPPDMWFATLEFSPRPENDHV